MPWHYVVRFIMLGADAGCRSTKRKIENRNSKICFVGKLDLVRRTFGYILVSNAPSKG